MARVDGARAQLDGARASLDGAEAQLMRSGARLDRGGASVDGARARHDGSAMRVRIAEAREDRARAWLDGRSTRFGGLSTAPNGLAALSAHRALSNRIRTRRAQAALDAAAATDSSERGERKPENHSVEDRIDREAGPDGPERKSS
jgi:multidrug resistance efflux pump